FSLRGEELNPMRRKRIDLLAATVFLAVFSVSTVSAQTEGAAAEKLAEALNHYSLLEFDKGLEIASGLLERPDLTAIDSVAILEALSIITYAKGEEYVKQSIEYLDKISEIGPCVSRLPQEIWPQELRDHWYRMAQAKNQLVCETEGSDEITTIAVMEFDNHSVGEYQEKLGALSKGLADFFQHDFAKISSLNVVERDKIDFVLKEIALQQSGSVDKATAVKVGKILGAQLMVFGTIMQLDARNTRMAVRVVKVETSEIIASVDEEGRPDYSKMEKGLVKKLAAELDIKLTKEVETLIDKGGTVSVDATGYYAAGLDAMDKYDYAAAYESFKKAYELDNAFVEAKRKMEIYRPLAG
ncbi:MAG: hypothetical protein JSU65_12860, partial [Candidatus Zixiibacteriota bacterium]